MDDEESYKQRSSGIVLSSGDEDVVREEKLKEERSANNRPSLNALNFLNFFFFVANTVAVYLVGQAGINGLPSNSDQSLKYQVSCCQGLSWSAFRRNLPLSLRIVVPSDALIRGTFPFPCDCHYSIRPLLHRLGGHSPFGRWYTSFRVFGQFCNFFQSFGLIPTCDRVSPTGISAFAVLRLCGLSSLPMTKYGCHCSSFLLSPLISLDAL